MRATGTVLVAVGVTTLLFVAYQLWGTGIQEARAQSGLEREFTAALGNPRATTAPAPSDRATRSTPPSAPDPAAGDAAARIRIPRLGVDKIVVEGVTTEDLKRGPGHYPGTALPGQVGNAAIAGHRTTYGAPFGNLDDLAPGDEIVVETLAGSFRYLVDRSFVVTPDRTDVLNPTPHASLTLTTCHPRFSARQRLVVIASLAGQPPAPPTATTLPIDAPPTPGAVPHEQPSLSGAGAPR
ncbi:MAG: class E sortase, partial [Acidimicrobiales bacterium]